MSQVRLTWTDNSNETGFSIERGDDGITYAEIGQVAANVVTYVDDTVIEGHTYYYRVRGFNGSLYTDYVIGNITIVVPAPTSLTASKTGAGATLFVTNNADDADAIQVWCDQVTAGVHTPGQALLETVFLAVPYGALSYFDDRILSFPITYSVRVKHDTFYSDYSNDATIP
jgi:hypothetical protein